MAGDKRGPNIGSPLESREDAAQAIANALAFLRDEARAAGMYDVHLAIELARAKASGYCPRSTESKDKG